MAKVGRAEVLVFGFDVSVALASNA